MPAQVPETPETKIVTLKDDTTITLNLRPITKLMRDEALEAGVQHHYRHNPEDAPGKYSILVFSRVFASKRIRSWTASDGSLTKPPNNGGWELLTIEAGTLIEEAIGIEEARRTLYVQDRGGEKAKNSSSGEQSPAQSQTTASSETSNSGEP